MSLRILRFLGKESAKKVVFKYPDHGVARSGLAWKEKKSQSESPIKFVFLSVSEFAILREERNEGDGVYVVGDKGGKARWRRRQRRRECRTQDLVYLFT